MVNSENSSVLDSGRRPELKSVEFSEFTIQGVELKSVLCLKPLNGLFTLAEHDSAPIVHTSDSGSTKVQRESENLYFHTSCTSINKMIHLKSSSANDRAPARER